MENPRPRATHCAPFLALVLAACGGHASTGPEPPPRLSVAGSTVLDPDGRPFVLRGYNWGDWDTVEPGDGAANAMQGANSVRIPLRWWGSYRAGVDSRDHDAPGHVERGHLQILDDAIHEATRNHLWVVLFLDSNYGQGAGGSTDNFWTNPAMKAEFVEVWQFLVERYRDEPYIAAWEILPEPMPPGVSDDEVRAFYDSIIPVIRALDPRTPIVVGPNLAYNLNHLEAAYTTIDSNLIYTGDYFIFDVPLSRIADITAFQSAHDVPVWINQVGVESGDVDAQAKARMVLEALRDIDVGWAWWTYRSHTNDPSRHGIFYLDPTDTYWIEKPEWLALVGDYLP